MKISHGHEEKNVEQFLFTFGLCKINSNWENNILMFLYISFPLFLALPLLSEFGKMQLFISNLWWAKSGKLFPIALKWVKSLP